MAELFIVRLVARKLQLTAAGRSIVLMSPMRYFFQLPTRKILAADAIVMDVE